MSRRPSALARARRRASQRGTTLLVVVLVITLLMGIGAWSARSAHLATAASGYERQQTQARYIAEYGLLIAVSQLSTGGGQAYITRATSPDWDDVKKRSCQGQLGLVPALDSPACYKMGSFDQNQLMNTGGFNLCEPTIGVNAGSLGMVNAPAGRSAECDFIVEFTDVVKGATPAGYNLQPNRGAPKFYYVTATSTGQVRIVNTDAAPKLDPLAGQSSATQTLRSRLLAGPFTL